MTTNNEHITSRLAEGLTIAVLFLVTFVYFGFFSGYTGFFQEKSSLFIFSRDYLLENIRQPGSLLIYLGNLLTTFCFYPVAGAFLISAVICLIALLTSRITRVLSGHTAQYLMLIPAVAAFILQTNYQYLLYNNPGLLLQLAFFYITIKYLKGWTPVFLFPAWYCISGGFAWVFGIMYTIYLLRGSAREGWIRAVALWTLSFALIIVLKEFFIFQPWGTMLLFPLSDADTGMQFRIFLPVIAIIALLPVLAGVRIRLLKKNRLPETIKIVLPSVLLLIFMVAVSILRYDRKTYRYFEVEKLFIQHKFSKVIDYNRKNPSANKLTIYLNNIALCETGKLNDQLFNFRQSPDGSTLFLKWEMQGEVLKRGGYFYYTVGMINEAHRWAYENMVMKGLTSEGLRMLIKTEIINGNYAMASKYISVMKKTLFYRKDAEYFERFLYNDQAVDTDPELGAKRKDKIVHDFFAITDDPYINVERILAFDSLNKKAFEYKLAYLLLKKDFNGIAQEIPKLERYGFSRIPVHLEEAALAYRSMNNGILPGGLNIPVSKVTESRFSQMIQIINNYKGDLQTAEPFLRPEFGSTFWYWVFYR